MAACLGLKWHDVCHVCVVTAVDTLVLPYSEPLLSNIMLIKTTKLHRYCDIVLQGQEYSVSLCHILGMALVVSYLLMCYMKRCMSCCSHVLCANKWTAPLVEPYLQTIEVCYLLLFTNTAISHVAWRLYREFCLIAFKFRVVNAICCVFSGSCTWCRS
jgi:hypothetical protein